MQLRKFLPSDKAEFMEMCKDFYGPSGATLHPIPEEQMERSFEQAISGNPYIVGYIMDEGGKAAGYGLIYPFYSNEAGGLCLMLEEIYVKPEYRSHRFGTQYLNEIASVFGGNVTTLKLEICPMNPRARKLYESIGFHELGYASMVKEV